MIRRRTILGLVLAILLLVTGFTGVVTAKPSNFRAHLSGGGEVPAVDTNATGQAIFRFNNDELQFKLIVANIHDVFAAHIHCGVVGVNGPVGVTLFAGDLSGRFNGILNQGTISAPNAGNACGWEDFDDVVAAIESGAAYVNVHTDANPGGEIRGQVH